MKAFRNEPHSPNEAKIFEKLKKNVEKSGTSVNHEGKINFDGVDYEVKDLFPYYGGAFVDSRTGAIYTKKNADPYLLAHEGGHFEHFLKRKKDADRFTKAGLESNDVIKQDTMGLFPATARQQKTTLPYEVEANKYGARKLLKAAEEANVPLDSRELVENLDAIKNKQIKGYQYGLNGQLLGDSWKYRRYNNR